MRLDPRLGLPAPARAARADRHRARRGRARRYRRDPAQGRAAARTMPRRMARREGGGGRRARRARPGRRHGGRGRAAASCPRPRTRPKRARPCPLLSGRRHRVHSAVTLIDADGTRAAPPVDLDRHLQAPVRRRARRLSRQRRMARQGRRLCHPGPRRSPGPVVSGSPFGRGRPAAVRDAGAAARRRLSRLAEWLYEEGIGEDRAILVEDGEIIEAAIELPGPLRAGAVVPARLASDPGSRPPRHRRARRRRRGAGRAAAARA